MSFNLASCHIFRICFSKIEKRPRPRNSSRQPWPHRLQNRLTKLREARPQEFFCIRSTLTGTQHSNYQKLSRVRGFRQCYLYTLLLPLGPNRYWKCLLQKNKLTCYIDSSAEGVLDVTTNRWHGKPLAEIRISRAALQLMSYRNSTRLLLKWPVGFINFRGRDRGGGSAAE